MRKLKCDDEVIVITGRDKGKRGTISRHVGTDRVIVHGVNMVKRHTKPNPNAGQPGGIVVRIRTGTQAFAMDRWSTRSNGPEKNRCHVTEYRGRGVAFPYAVGPAVVIRDSRIIPR